MQAVVGRQEAKRRASAIAAAKQEDGSSLSMYVEPPSEDISIEDFEAFALDRLAGTFHVHFAENVAAGAAADAPSPHLRSAEGHRGRTCKGYEGR